MITFIHSELFDMTNTIKSLVLRYPYTVDWMLKSTNPAARVQLPVGIQVWGPCVNAIKSMVADIISPRLATNGELSFTNNMTTDLTRNFVCVNFYVKVSSIV